MWRRQDGEKGGSPPRLAKEHRDGPQSIQKHTGTQRHPPPDRGFLASQPVSVYLGHMNALLSRWIVSMFSTTLVARLNTTSMYKEAERRGDWHSRRGERVFRM